MELCIPHRLLHPLRVREIDLAQNAVVVCGNKSHFGRMRRVTRDEHRALNRIVRQLVRTAVGDRIAEPDRVTDSWWAHVEIDCLEEAVAISDPENIVG